MKELDYDALYKALAGHKAARDIETEAERVLAIKQRDLAAAEQALADASAERARIAGLVDKVLAGQGVGQVTVRGLS